MSGVIEDKIGRGTVCIAVNPAGAADHSAMACPRFGKVYLGSVWGSSHNTNCLLRISVVLAMDIGMIKPGNYRVSPIYWIRVGAGGKSKSKVGLCSCIGGAVLIENRDYGSRNIFGSFKIIWIRYRIPVNPNAIMTKSAPNGGPGAATRYTQRVFELVVLAVIRKWPAIHGVHVDKEIIWRRTRWFFGENPWVASKPRVSQRNNNHQDYPSRKNGLQICIYLQKFFYKKGPPTFYSAAHRLDYKIVVHPEF